MNGPARGPLALGCLFTLLVAAGCGTAHHARPLGRGNGAASLQVGGPFVAVGDGAAPLGLIVATGKAGVTERLDVYGSWHVMETFVAEGNAVFDLGFSYYAVDQRGARPGLSLAFTETFLFNAEDAWTAFDLQVTASWLIARRHLVYLGFHNYLTPLPPEVVETSPYSFAPYLGGEVRVGKRRELGLALQVTWARPWVSNEGRPVDLKSPGELGAFALTGGFSFYFERRRADRTAGGAAGEGAR